MDGSWDLIRMSRDPLIIFGILLEFPRILGGFLGIFSDGPGILEKVLKTSIFSTLGILRDLFVKSRDLRWDSWRIPTDL